MRKPKFTSVIAVMPVSDYQASLAWYSKFLGAPDVEPEEGTGE